MRRKQALTDLRNEPLRSHVKRVRSHHGMGRPHGSDTDRRVTANMLSI